MHSLQTALRGKGLQKTLSRTRSIAARYGWNARKMKKALFQIKDTLECFSCQASFPVTCAALARHPELFQLQNRNDMEFAVHGYYHVDLTQLSLPEQRSHLARAAQLFSAKGHDHPGFRAPYLRWNEDTLTALQEAGYLYDSSQGLYWEVLNGTETDAYRRVLNFYQAQSARAHPSLPSREGTLIRIPYSLPDDEAFIERLGTRAPSQIKAIWSRMLHASHQLGEFFTLSIHPERIGLCCEALQDILAEARSLSPPVWIARLSDIAEWWRAKDSAQIHVSSLSRQRLTITAVGPPGLALFGRGLSRPEPTLTRADGYQRLSNRQAVVPASPRPFLGVSPQTHPQWKAFLRQQGYILEPTSQRDTHTFYLDRPTFSPAEKRPLLEEIENSTHPLVRLGRWPDGARSAMAITGDIDSVTLIDYGMRIFGR